MEKEGFFSFVLGVLVGEAEALDGVDVDLTRHRNERGRRTDTADLADKSSETLGDCAAVLRHRTSGTDTVGVDFLDGLSSVRSLEEVILLFFRHVEPAGADGRREDATGHLTVGDELLSLCAILDDTDDLHAPLVARGHDDLARTHSHVAAGEEAARSATDLSTVLKAEGEEAVALGTVDAGEEEVGVSSLGGCGDGLHTLEGGGSTLLGITLLRHSVWDVISYGGGTHYTRPYPIQFFSAIESDRLSLLRRTLLHQKKEGFFFCFGVG